MAWILGLAWGAICALPLVARGRRAMVGERVELLREPPPPAPGAFARHRLPTLPVPAWVRTPADTVVRVTRSLASRRQAHAHDAALARELPVVVDLLGVAISAGCTPYLAVEVASRWGPPRSASALSGVLRACALGTGFERALDDAVSSAPPLRPLADALLASDRLGAPVGPQLSRLAAEERASLRRRAEAHARRVPVKLLFPLVFLVLPAFVLLTVVPGLVSGLQRL